MTISSATKTTVRCAAALSTLRDTSAAVRQVCEEARESLHASVDLAMLFVSAHHAENAGAIARQAADALDTQHLLGCTGEAIVGGGREIENQPAISLWLAHLPQTNVATMHLEFQLTAEGGSFSGWPESTAGDWPPGAALLLVGDPFSFPADHLLARLNEDRPGVPVLGGMASGGAGPGENHLLLGSRVFDRGGVAALVSGPVRVRSVVSQGCRPIGRPLVITKAQQNVILELGGIPALARLKEIFGTLTEREQQLVRGGLHVGLVLNEYQTDHRRGDFLIRNVIGADQGSGAIAIGDHVRVGQTVQFHIRDAETADEDLRELLGNAPSSAPPAGALLFTCNGRGTRLFPTPDHDAAGLRSQWPELPVAGFFAQGELGPVGGRNCLHGFTASVALFEST